MHSQHIRMPIRRPSHLPAIHPLALALHLIFGGTCLAAAILPTPSMAQAQSAAREFDIPAGPLPATLNRIGESAGLLLSFDPALVKGKTAPAIKGRMTAQQALEQALSSSGLEVAPGGDGTYTLKKALPAPAKPEPTAPLKEAVLPAVTVRAGAGRETATGPVVGYVAKRSATATKTDTPLIETPQSLTILTADRIAATGAVNMRDALGYVPGVKIEPLGPDSRLESTWINIRGFESIQPGPYQDGLPLRNNWTWGAWRTENYATERLEVMRGPSSVLYGQAKPGGLVNVVSKRPQPETQNEVQVQLGNNHRRQLAGDFTGAFDAEGVWQYRLTSVIRNAEYPVDGINDDRYFLAPALTWKPNGDTSLTLLSHVMRDRAGVYSRYAMEEGSLRPTAAGTKVPKTYLGDPEFDHMEHDQWSIGYLFEHRLADNLQFRQNLRYGQLRAKLDQIFVPSGYVTINSNDPSDPQNFRILERTTFGSNEKVRSLAIDNQLTATWKTGNWSSTFLTGLDYQNSHFDQTTYQGDAFAPLDLYAPVYGQSITKGDPYFDGWTRLKQLGVYGQWQGKWHDQLVLTLGARNDWASMASDNKVDGSSDQQRKSKPTGRAGVVWLMDSGVAPYISYATSFFPVTTINPDTGKAFNPETGQQWELGVRFQPKGSEGMLSASLFDLRRQNYITTDGAGVPRQLGEVTVKGLEVEALLKPLRAMNLTFSYTLTPTAKVSKSVAPEDIGKNFNGTSRHGLSAWADYRWANGITAGTGFRYTSSNHGDSDTANAKVPGYTLWDAMLGYDTGPWAMRLNVRNLAGKEYIASCGYGWCYYGTQRQINLTAAYRW